MSTEANKRAGAEIAAHQAKVNAARRRGYDNRMQHREQRPVFDHPDELEAYEQGVAMAELSMGFVDVDKRLKRG